MNDEIIRQLSTRDVYRNPWLTLREDEIEFPDGSHGVYTVIDKPDFAVVLPWENGGFWLVQQFRYPVGRREWEFPQGGWPDGHHGTPADLAAAELREETGLRAARFTHLGRLWAAYGFCSQAYDVFLAEDLTPGAPDRESTEADMVHAWVGRGRAARHDPSRRVRGRAQRRRARPLRQPERQPVRQPGRQRSRHPARSPRARSGLAAQPIRTVPVRIAAWWRESTTVTVIRYRPARL